MSFTFKHLAATLVLAISPVLAQDPAAESHPAAKIVKEYNQCILTEAWDKAASLIEPISLEGLRDDYVERAKQPGVLSLDDEKLLLEKFGVKSLDAIKKVDGKKFYTTYRALVQPSKNAPVEVMKRVRETMKLTILGVVEEKEIKKAHVLVRSKHDNGKQYVDNLELVSLIFENGKWMVGLNEQTPKVTKIARTADDPAAPPKAAKALPK